MNDADAGALREAFTAGAEWGTGPDGRAFRGEAPQSHREEAARRYPDAPVHACPACGRTDVALTKAGLMRHHNGNLRVGGWRQVCFGVGQHPVVTP